MDAMGEPCAPEDLGTEKEGAHAVANESVNKDLSARGGDGSDGEECAQTEGTVCTIAAQLMGTNMRNIHAC